MSEIVELTTTVETKAQARQLAEHLIERRLAACVQINGPLTSVYRWQGNVCESEEYRCTIKSTAAMSAVIFEAIEAAHPYDVPEILMLPVLRGSDNYHAWLVAQVEPTDRDPPSDSATT